MSEILTAPEALSMTKKYLPIAKKTITKMMEFEIERAARKGATEVVILQDSSMDGLDMLEVLHDELKPLGYGFEVTPQGQSVRVWWHGK